MATRPSRGSRITKAASRQTYYTIRLLADRGRVEDAYRAYAYFRWVDDVLDGEPPTTSASVCADRSEREAFLDRQKALLDRCLHGEAPADPDWHEVMLVELVRHADRRDGRLEAYLRQMMQVMEFDVRRRGLVVSGAELTDYTRRLAIAVTEAMHYFIGHADATPPDEGRYAAVSGAHILHMLRDTYDDVRLGYYNVPREVLEAGSIGPADISSGPYRAWVADRVELARTCLDAGKTYLGCVRSRRHRLAGLAYIARFEWLIEALQRDGYRLRANYGEPGSMATGLRRSWWAIASVAGLRAPATRSMAVASSEDRS